MSRSTAVVTGLVLLSLSSLAKVYAISEDKCGFYKLKLDTNVHPGKRLVNHGILNVTVAHLMLCFNKCTENCLCESFNVCGKKCELSSSTKEKAPNDHKSKTECTYYDLARVSRSEYPQIQDTCSGSPKRFCCRTHNPCLNGGECIGFCPDLGMRFQCKCKNGFGGERCLTKAYTCQDFLTSPKPANGMYTVLDENNAILHVYCDFHSEVEMAWTLFMSRDGHQNVESFVGKFSPWNPNQTEINWAQYRPSKPTVVHLSKKSTHWRTTCEYEKMEIDYVDYLRSKISVTDPITYKHGKFPHGEKCRLVEYVNIRGRQCTDCTIFLGQGENCVLHSSTFGNIHFGCDFDGSGLVSDCPPGSTQVEFYFNCFGHGCNSRKHRCSKVAESTTQFWFGG